MCHSSRRIAPLLLVVAGFSILSAAQTTPPPSWLYSTYLGGSGADTITATTRDDAGNLYLAGITSSSDFPTTTGVYEATYPGPPGVNAIFVSKFSAEGALVWSTFLGPGSSNFLVPSGLAVDGAQNVYVAGIFEDRGFPITPGLPNSGSVFVVKLNATASQVVYGTTLGGNSTAANPGLVLDSANNAFVTGSGEQGCCSGHTGVIGPLGGGGDFWVLEINAAGTGIPWSVVIGGSDLDMANGLAIDANNKLYVTGYTASSDFPTVTGSLRQPGPAWAFVVKLDPAKAPASSLMYSALAGNVAANNTNSFEVGEAVALDSLGDAFVGAWTYNPGLITSKWAYQPTALGEPNVYVFELNPAGSAIVNGTYLGGSNADYVFQVATDNAGNVYVGGFTNSPDFPYTAYGNNGQAYYVKLNPQFAAISSVEFGGSGYPETFGLATDGSGGLWAAGYDQGGLATTANAYQPLYQGNGDGFLVHTDFAPLCSDGGGAELCSIAADPNLSERVNFTGQAADVEQTVNTSLSIDGMIAYGVHAAQFDAWLPVAPGEHIASIVSQTALGQKYENSQAFTVAPSTSCPLNPVILSLTLCSPLNASVIKGNVTVQATVDDSAPPQAVQLYVDGKFVATVAGQSGSYTYTLQLSPGVHHITVQGTDSGNDFLSTSAVLRVVS